jgi:hypothetical protein
MRSRASAGVPQAVRLFVASLSSGKQAAPDVRPAARPARGRPEPRRVLCSLARSCSCLRKPPQCLRQHWPQPKFLRRLRLPQPKPLRRLRLRLQKPRRLRHSNSLPLKPLRRLRWPPPKPRLTQPPHWRPPRRLLRWQTHRRRWQEPFHPIRRRQAPTQSRSRPRISSASSRSRALARLGSVDPEATRGTKASAESERRSTILAASDRPQAVSGRPKRAWSATEQRQLLIGLSLLPFPNLRTPS